MNTSETTDESSHRSGVATAAAHDNPQDTGDPAQPHTVKESRRRRRHEDQPDTIWTRLLESIDTFVYVLVGACFCLAALLSLAYGIYLFATQILGQVFTPSGFTLAPLVDKSLGAQDVITLVSDLLLTLIIMEVLGTVVHHLRDKETTLKPFLFIGIISATRGILAVGARLSISANSSITDTEFKKDMVELAVNAAVIIALGIAMKLIGRYIDDSASPRHAHPPRQSP
ncbi:MAG: phosphate-starvation-inducible PsiE family protein [Ktedonobacterales bacterium]